MSPIFEELSPGQADRALERISRLERMEPTSRRGWDQQPCTALTMYRERGWQPLGLPFGRNLGPKSTKQDGIRIPDARQGENALIGWTGLCCRRPVSSQQGTSFYSSCRYPECLDAGFIDIKADSIDAEMVAKPSAIGPG